MKIYIIGDTHFNHDNIIKYCNRPIDYQSKILQNWNRKVTNEDLVIHLGDVILYNKKELFDIMNGLNGRKILVKGNHDKESHLWYMRNGFAFCCDTFTYQNITFSHTIQSLSVGDVCNGRINVFAHSHKPVEKWDEKDRKLITPNHRLFVLEHHYSPIELGKFISKKGKKEWK